MHILILPLVPLLIRDQNPRFRLMSESGLQYVIDKFQPYRLPSLTYREVQSAEADCTSRPARTFHVFNKKPLFRAETAVPNKTLQLRSPLLLDYCVSYKHVLYKYSQISFRVNFFPD